MGNSCPTENERVGFEPPRRNLNHGEVQQTVLWRVMLNKFSFILSLLRKVYLEAFRVSSEKVVTAPHALGSYRVLVAWI
jgi:hypothetical protein